MIELKHNQMPQVVDIEEYSAIKLDYTKRGYNIVEIDGLAVSGKSDIFNSFFKSLKFPDYFGKNWDALYDCITDLGWLKNKNTVVLIKEIDEREIFKILKHALMDAKEFWLNTNERFPEKVDFETIIFIEHLKQKKI